MWEHPQRAVGGDLPAPTRVWLKFHPPPVQAWRTLLTELRPRQEAWIWSLSDSISSSRLSASDKETLVDVLIFLVSQVLGVSERPRLPELFIQAGPPMHLGHRPGAETLFSIMFSAFGRARLSGPDPL